MDPRPSDLPEVAEKRARVRLRSAEIYTFAEEQLEDVARQQWLGGVATPHARVKRKVRGGITSASTLHVALHVDVFMKVDPDQIIREWSGFRLLRSHPGLLPHLVRPLDEARGTPTAWIVPLLDAVTVHTAVCQGLVSDAWAGRVYADILDAFEAYWLGSRVDGSPTLEGIYFDRVSSSLPYIAAGLKRVHKLRASARKLQNLPITVNGSELLPSLAESSSQVAAQTQRMRAPYSYTIHGDEHGRNIMIYRRFLEAEPSTWVLVDYAAAENQSDWLIPIAKMLWWWNWQAVLEMAMTHEALKLALDVRVSDRDGVLAFRYNEEALTKYRPSAVSEITSVITERAEQIASRFGEDPTQWQERLTLAQIALLFSSSRHQFRSSKGAFGAALLLAQGLKLLWPDKASRLRT